MLMGIKFLSLQMIPWCFHLMGNHISCVQLRPEPPVETIKLINSDGLVKIYRRPINVSELMLEFPKHLVCNSDSFYIGQKIPALSEEEQLQLGQKYFLLPKTFFQSVLSFVTIASFASSPSPSSLSESKKAFLKTAANCPPFDIRKTPSGSLQIHVSDEFISKLIKEGGKIEEEEEEEKEEDEKNSSKVKGSSGSRVCTTPQLQKDYTQLVRSQKWKPKLETIRESAGKRKLASLGMKRRKKSPSSKGIQKSTQRSSEQNLHKTYTTTTTTTTTTTLPSSKPKTKIKSKKGVLKF